VNPPADVTLGEPAAPVEARRVRERARRRPKGEPGLGRSEGRPRERAERRGRGVVRPAARAAAPTSGPCYRPERPGGASR
jgi:hypothetical protein